MIDIYCKGFEAECHNSSEMLVTIKGANCDDIFDDIKSRINDSDIMQYVVDGVFIDDKYCVEVLEKIDINIIKEFMKDN